MIVCVNFILFSIDHYSFIHLFKQYLKSELVKQKQTNRKIPQDFFFSKNVHSFKKICPEGRVRSIFGWEVVLDFCS